jgi:multimeric flavodoxin WrbA
MKVIAIVGSPHTDGNTSFLVDEAFKEIGSKGIDTEKIILSQYVVNPCQGHDNCGSFPKCKQRDDAPRIIDKFNQADGVIMASPVYFYDVSAQTKAFIDRNFFTFTHGGSKKARCAGLIAIGGGGGADETIATLKRFIGLPEKQVFAVSGYTGDTPVKNHPDLVEQAHKMGAKIAKELSQKKMR